MFLITYVLLRNYRSLQKFMSMEKDIFSYTLKKYISTSNIISLFLITNINFNFV